MFKDILDRGVCEQQDDCKDKLVKYVIILWMSA